MSRLDRDDLVPLGAATLPRGSGLPPGFRSSAPVAPSPPPTNQASVPPAPALPRDLAGPHLETVPTAPKVHVPEEWRQGSASLPVAPQGRGAPPKSILVLAALAVVAVTAAAASIAWRLAKPRPTVAAVPTATSPPAPVPPPPPEVEPTKKKTTGATASTAKETRASTPVAPPKDPRVCFGDLLAEDGLSKNGPSLERSCTKTSDYGAMLVLKTEIVRNGRRRVTPAMAEWSRLGWYETAAFAAMRAHCCPDAAALGSPSRFEVCRMEESLAYIANAIDDEKAMAEALGDYQRAATCIARKGGGGAYGRRSLPGRAEQVYVQKILGRMKAVRKK